MRGLRGKRIIIAGGATGIGAATAERLAEEGASVVVGDINLAGAEATAKRVSGAGGTAFAWKFDLSDEDSIRELVDRTVTKFGGVDGLYNVGADLSPDTIGRDADLLGMDPAVWRRTYEVNLLGYALTCRTVLPHLLGQRGGIIVNTSSQAAWGGEPERPAYASSKAGINALTRHIASRWGKEGIRCNAVAPGAVMGETQLRMGIIDEQMQAMALQMQRSPRLGVPSDLANAVTFLFSDDAEWINGQTWSICGGISLRE
ncbi:SDR family NAD(P)-dependent oxidoreductase [Streptomyces sp. NPDC090493]|uniref:SDR family NAD(P)-dependent oxidoreductase n=1 Tax=Streptomyces sp. NPDC090493 TaxID=3365964 RepID=UPI003825230A